MLDAVARHVLVSRFRSSECVFFADVSAGCVQVASRSAIFFGRAFWNLLDSGCVFFFELSEGGGGGGTFNYRNYLPFFVTATVTYCKQMTAGCLEAWHVLDAVPRCALDSCCHVQHFVSYAEYVVLGSSCDFTYMHTLPPSSRVRRRCYMFCGCLGGGGCLNLKCRFRGKPHRLWIKREAHMFFSLDLWNVSWWKPWTGWFLQGCKAALVNGFGWQPV